MITTKTDLMAHQKAAYEKLNRLKVGALYMGMGTGKTRTTIELIAKRFNAGKVNHVLWFCPCSVKENLRRDIVYHSDGLIENTTIVGIESISMSDRTYMECLETVQKYKCFLIVDESNLVKNHLALRTKRIISLAEVCEYKLILNGTPVTRNEADLYAQWYILDKRIFGYRSYYSFAANHIEEDENGRIRRVLNVDYLTEKIAPYSFEISKDECLDLPRKLYEDFYFEFPFFHSLEYYNALEYYTTRVDEMDETTIYRLLTALQLVSSGRRLTLKSGRSIKHEPYYENPLNNPRIKMLEYIVRQIENEKIIIWCKYHFEIDDVKVLLNSLGISYVEFHGKIPLSKRDAALDAFKNDKDIQVMIGNKASGGYGLNLQFCNNMIYYSSDFDWGTSIQSEDRIHRIGQTKVCTYYSIWADAGIDRMIQECLSNKQTLESAVRRMLNEKNYLEALK